jgi:hypothetical protein
MMMMSRAYNDGYMLDQKAHHTPTHVLQELNQRQQAAARCKAITTVTHHPMFCVAQMKQPTHSTAVQQLALEHAMLVPAPCNSARVLI